MKSGQTQEIQRRTIKVLATTQILSGVGVAGTVAAGSFVSMSVPLLVFFSLQRYFIRGLTAGAVK